MSQLREINLIRLFDFYLMLMFVIGLLRRWTLYRDSLLLGLAIAARMPRLRQRLGQHRDILLNWPTLRPVLAAVILMAVQFILSRLIWPQATLVAEQVLASWWQVLLMLGFIVPMVAVDVYFLISVGHIDRGEAETYLARAEHWLGTWKAPLIRTMTLGFVNPHRMVDDQVREGLAVFRGTVTWSMWWVCIQVGLRLAVGLTIWLLWAYVD
jgi:hypothetical protein